MTIEECWEKHKHLDASLADKEWMLWASDDNDFLEIALGILCDCWQAIKDGHEKSYDAQRERENET